MQKKGFTLIEILVVITIIAVLTAIGVVSYQSVNKRARDSKRKSDMEQVRSALEMYRVDKGYYPGGSKGVFTALDVLDPGDGTLLVPSYMPSIPKDSKNASYYYAPVGTVAPFYSYCICGNLESETGSTTCAGVILPGQCNYGIKNP